MGSYMGVQDGVEYNCSATDSALFAQGQAISQAKIPWASNTKYARWTMYYYVVLVFLLIAYRLINYVSDRRYQGRGTTSGPSSFVRRLFALVRYVGYRRYPVISRYTAFPSQMNVLAVLFSAFLFLLCIVFIPHFWYRACSGFGSPPLSIRAGLVTNALTPLIYTLSGKSNVVTGLTGISYERLNVYHQTIAWLSLFFAWVHAVPFMAQPMWEGGAKFLHQSYYGDDMMTSGTVTIVLLVTLCFFSLRTIRDRFYEFFLHYHWPTAIAYFGILFWHTGGSLESWCYLWATLALWSAGLLYRYFTKTSYLSIRKDWFRTETATLRVLPDNAVEVRIISSRFPNWAPGQHTFVRFASIQPLGNHPFTIGSLPKYSLDESTVELRLIARPYSGFTKTLYEQAVEKSEQEYKVFWDGPYGGMTRRIEAFDDVVLFCSGSGATAVIPFLEHICGQLKDGVVARTKCIRLVWIVHNLGTFSWYEENLQRALAELPEGVSVHCQVHVTREDLASSSDDKEQYTAIEFIQGRPNIEEIMSQFSSTFGPRTVVISSGCDAVRSRVANATADLQMNVVAGRKNAAGVAPEEIYLHTETFGW
ncbi:ferric/cupric reductase transmembrane component 7 [Trichomonascus vanleenenianus]|uniref:ferric reductase family protein n=1 Tax=Trichomonascus vanleenenianus TaxID=2268995 RepID=UPI003ECB1FC7